MKNIPFLFLGIFFGIVLSKGEVISWFRIQEMFRFDGFHMYGVIGSAVVLGIIAIKILKSAGVRDRFGMNINLAPKEKNFKQYLFGGTIFGLGWALTGACPGPIYTLVGYGYWGFVIVLISAVAGTFLYGILKSKLPH